MTAIADLWTQTTGRFTALVGRYWLLASRPSAYFDKFIKDQLARELRHTIVHSVLAISAIPLSLSALTSADSLFFGDLPPWLTTTLTSKFLFVGVVILATIPALVLTGLVYILVRASISDLVFIYFNILTIYSIGAFAYLLVFWIVVLLLLAALWITTGTWQFQPLFQSSVWMYLIIMVPACSIFAMYYYVPTLLVERSTGKSTLFASTVCIVYFTISAWLMAIGYQTTIGPITIFTGESADLERCSRNEGGPDLTIASCTAVIDAGRYSRPYLRFAFVNRGDAYVNKRQYDDAIRDYAEAIRSNPTDAATFIRRGDAYFDKLEYDRAIDDYSAALRLDPRNIVAFSQRANAHFSKREYDRAIEDYTAAIDLDPANPNGFYDRALTLSMKQDYTHAMEDYNTVIALDPKYVNALIDRGILFNKKGEHDRAIKDLDEAIGLDPTQARAFNSRGVAYDGKGLHDRALDDYNEAIRLDPRLVAARLNRAALYFSTKEYDRAIDDYSVAIILDPRNANALRSRGNAYLARRATGDAARAKADLDAAKRLGK